MPVPREQSVRPRTLERPHMAIPAVRAASGFPLPRCGAGMAPYVCHHGLTLVSCHEVSSGKVGGVTMAGPFEGPERS